MDNLSEALIAAFQPDLITKANAMGVKIRTENGATDCIRVMIDLLKNKAWEDVHSLILA